MPLKKVPSKIAPSWQLSIQASWSYHKMEKKRLSYKLLIDTGKNSHHTAYDFLGKKKMSRKQKNYNGFESTGFIQQAYFKGQNHAKEDFYCFSKITPSDNVYNIYTLFFSQISKHQQKYKRKLISHSKSFFSK